MNDRTKHRIVGVVIIAAFLVILVPALMKHENAESKKTQHASNERPVTAMVEPVSSASVEAEMYQTSQVAQVSLDHASPNKESTQPLAESSQYNNEYNTGATDIEQNLNKNVNKTVDSIEAMDSSVMETNKTNNSKASTALASPAPTQETVVNKGKASVRASSTVQPKAVKKAMVSTPPPAHIQSTSLIQNTAKRATVCWQLGTFSNPTNANLLLQKLKAKGFLTAKKTTLLLPKGKRVEKISYCKAMSGTEISSVQAKLALIAGTKPFITR